MRITALLVSCFFTLGLLSQCNTSYAKELVAHDSLKVLKADSLSLGKDERPFSIEMSVEYNFIVLDKVEITTQINTTAEASQIKYYPVGSFISLAMEKIPGNGLIYLKMDDAPMFLYLHPVRLPVRGTHTLELWRRDNFGNEINCGSLRFRILDR